MAFGVSLLSSTMLGLGCLLAAFFVILALSLYIGYNHYRVSRRDDECKHAQKQLLGEIIFKTDLCLKFRDEPATDESNSTPGRKPVHSFSPGRGASFRIARTPSSNKAGFSSSFRA